MTAFTGLLISCAMPATRRPIEASFSLRTRLSCARRSFSSASRSSTLRCSRASVRRRTSRSRSMLIDSVERRRSRSARRISSKATARRPISSASPDGGSGRASSPRAISSERASSAWMGATSARASARPAPPAPPRPRHRRRQPRPRGRPAAHHAAPPARARGRATTANTTSNLRRSPKRERISPIGRACREPRWRTSGASMRRPSTIGKGAAPPPAPAPPAATPPPAAAATRAAGGRHRDHPRQQHHEALVAGQAIRQRLRRAKGHHGPRLVARRAARARAAHGHVEVGLDGRDPPAQASATTAPPRAAAPARRTARWPRALGRSRRHGSSPEAGTAGARGPAMHERQQHQPAPVAARKEAHALRGRKDEARTAPQQPPP